MNQPPVAKQPLHSQGAVLKDIYKKIHAFVSRRVQRKEDVEDLVQTIFLKMGERSSQIRDEKKMVSWLYTIARNQIIDYYRTRKVMDQLPEDLKEHDPEENFTSEVVTWMIFFILLLNNQDQEILRLVEIEGKTQKQAAEELGISLSGAKSRHQRAKKRLREKLEICCQYNFDNQGNIIDFKKNNPDDCCVN